MQSRTKLHECKFCGKDVEIQYMETVSQIPERVCPQEFITTSQISKRSSKLLLTTDLVCTEHEPLFHLKYVSYKRGGSFSAGFNPKYNRLNQVLNPAPCKRCSKLSTNLRKISGCKNLRFIQFIIDEGIQRVTRKQGTGISQDDHLCSSCYMVLRRKYYHQNYSPIKRKRTDKQRKESESKQLPHQPSKQTCIQPSSTSQSTEPLQIDVSDGFRSPQSPMLSPIHGLWSAQSPLLSPLNQQYLRVDSLTLPLSSPTFKARYSFSSTHLASSDSSMTDSFSDRSLNQSISNSRIF